MPCEYTIKLKPDAKPYSFFTARKIPIPLRDKVQHEFKQMESSGVISKVDQPTTWCSGMVVVQKKSGGVQICVDLKHLNENVLREVCPMSHVDETLSFLAGAKVFSTPIAGFGRFPWQTHADILLHSLLGL